MAKKKTYEKPLKIELPFDEALERFSQAKPHEVRDSIQGDQGKPVQLIEDVDTGDRFLGYTSTKGIELELRFDGDEPWASETQMAEIFGVTQQNINYHINKIYSDQELIDPETTYKEILYVGSTGQQYPRKIYNIDVVLAVGYRVGSGRGIQFRRWANSVLRQYLLKGFIVNKRQLKGQLDRISELREIIRDIRLDEANVYAELRRICSMCSDYDPSSDAAREFYAHMQAKLYWAVVSHTPSEVLRDRIRADAVDLGLHTWTSERILQADALNAKNALAPHELKELNRVHDILLSVFEDQLDIGRLTMMKDAERLLDEQLNQLGRRVLRHGGSISSEDAKAHAKAQYKLFDQRRKVAEKARVEAELAELKKLSKGRKPAAKKK